jgi:hypothetical protein
MCLWAAVFVIIDGAGLLLTSVWPAIQVFEDTLILFALAAACFINFGRNRTLHCGITGPLFLIGGLAAALIEAGVWRFDLAVVWGLVLLGVGIAFVIEWRAVGLGNSQDACTPRP